MAGPPASSPLSASSPAADEAEGDAPDDQTDREELHGKLQALQSRVGAGRRKSFLLGNGVLLAVVPGVVCMAGYHLTSVFRYAQLDTAPSIIRKATAPDRLTLVYQPTSAGLVGFRRTNADHDTELLDRVLPEAVGKRQSFQWRAAGVRQGDVIQVTCREGLFLRRWEVSVPEASSAESLGEGELVGRIVNATNNEPVADAQIRLLGADLTCRTDADGWFHLENGPRATPESRSRRRGLPRNVSSAS